MINVRRSRFARPGFACARFACTRFARAQFVGTPLTWIVTLVVSTMMLLGASPVMAADTFIQWDWFDRGALGGATWWGYIEEQMKERWGVDFEVSAGWDEARVPISISSGITIDSIQVPFHQAANWTEAGLLYPITDYIARDESVSLDDFIPESFQPVTMDGEIYALPWIMDFELVLVNVDLFREVGLDPSVTDDWDWDDFLEVARTLTVIDSNGDVTRTGFAGWMNRWTWMTFLFSNGGLFFNEDETQAAFNTPQGLEALEFLTAMHLEHRVMQPGFEGEQAFIDGRSGMTLSGPWVEAFWDFPMEFDFAMIPKGPSADQPSTRSWVNYRAIPATTSDPDLAWQYLSWYNSLRAIKYEMIGTHRSPYLPFYFTTEWERSLDERPWNHKIPYMLQLSQLDPQRAAAYWSDPVNELIMDAIAGERSPADALAQAETIVNAGLSR